MLGGAEEHEEREQQQEETRGQEVAAVGVICQKRLRRLVHRVICRRGGRKTEERKRGEDVSQTFLAQLQKLKKMLCFFPPPPQNKTLED